MPPGAGCSLGAASTAPGHTQHNYIVHSLHVHAHYSINLVVIIILVNLVNLSISTFRSATNGWYRNSTFQQLNASFSTFIYIVYF